MSLAPRVVLVYRRTELDDLLARHGTRGQAAFFLSTRGRGIDEVERRHRLQSDARAEVADAIPMDWRRGAVERADLARFIFAPEDIVVVVGQDGLVANVAKYLDRQVVIGINPDPARNPGVLVPHAPGDARELLRLAVTPAARALVDERTMVRVTADDGRSLLALNEIFIGPPTHQTARYTLATADGRRERQASSGLIAASGTGATGWCRSILLERRSELPVPSPTDTTLLWFVREAWPSPATGTTWTQGALRSGDALTVAVESDRLVAFGDGIEGDHLDVTWGQTATIDAAPRLLCLLRHNATEGRQAAHAPHRRA